MLGGLTLIEDHKITKPIIRRFYSYNILVEKIATLKKFNLDCHQEESELLELKKILTALPQTHREMFILHAIQKHPLKDIALDYNVSIGVVRHKISEVYARL